MITPKQCWFVCNDKLFRATKWLLSVLSIVFSSALVIALEVS